MRYLSVLAIITAAALTGFVGKDLFLRKNADKIQWLTWEQAVELNRTHPKKILIDVYTDWSGWNKRMDAGVFTRPEISRYINENFYPVKLNAEQREPIFFGKDTFSFVETGKGRGINAFANTLLNGKMNYPALVYLDENYRRILVSPGYKESEALMVELQFSHENHWKTQSWEFYKRGNP